MRGRTPADCQWLYNVSIETGDATMTATRDTNLIPHTMIAAGFVIALIAAIQAIAILV